MRAVPSPIEGYKLLEFKYGPYSPSRLLSARCPARFYGQYVAKDYVSADSVAASRGTVIHSVLEQIDERRKAGASISPNDIQTWINAALSKNPAAYSELELIKRAANAYIGNPSPYWTQHTACEIRLNVAVFEERTFLEDAVPDRVCVLLGEDERGRPAPGTFMTAIIDQMSVDHELRQVTVVDHKSTPTANKNSDHEFQLGCYAWMVSMLYPGYAVRTVIHYAHPDLNFYGAPTNWTPQELSTVGEELLFRAQAIESFESFPAVPGGYCGYCHMVQGCPDNLRLQEQQARGTVDLNVRNFDDVLRIAKAVRTTEVLYDQLYKSLKEGIEKYATEGVHLDGLWYGYKVSADKVDWDATSEQISALSASAQERATLNADGVVTEKHPSEAEIQRVAKYGDLLGMLRQYGYTAEDFTKFDTRRLDTLWKTGSEQFLAELKKYVVTEKSTRFGGYKK